MQASLAGQQRPMNFIQISLDEKVICANEKNINCTKPLHFVLFLNGMFYLSVEKMM